MSPLIGPKQVQELMGLRELASGLPVDITTLAARLQTEHGRMQHRARMTQQSVLLPPHYVVVYSVEVGHPVGECRHMSMSTSRPGYLPAVDAVQMVAELLGFVGSVLGMKFWVEEQPGFRRAVNLVQPLSVPISLST